jgi:hypothetical protein
MGVALGVVVLAAGAVHGDLPVGHGELLFAGVIGRVVLGAALVVGLAGAGEALVVVRAAIGAGALGSGDSGLAGITLVALGGHRIRFAGAAGSMGISEIRNTAAVAGALELLHTAAGLALGIAVHRGSGTTAPLGVIIAAIVIHSTSALRGSRPFRKHADRQQGHDHTQRQQGRYDPIFPHRDLPP